MPLLKRINTASGVLYLSSENARLAFGRYFTLRVESRTINSGTIRR